VTSKPKLSVNLNKVALLRNTRALGIPSVTRAAVIALDAGAQGITVHPRPDERHIRGSDVHELHELLRGYPEIEFNIEGNPFENALDLVREVRPHQFTLVPDDPAQATSDHGWDLERDGERLRRIVEEVKGLGVRVSFFMDADPKAMARAAALGADRIELYTEPYAKHFGSARESEVLAAFTATARAAREAGLGVNAGHDLNQHNLPRFVAEVPGVLEVSIGHALIADALETGLAATVRAYLAAIGTRL
jgi:pyridoxine 5-phosphate synthase